MTNSQIVVLGLTKYCIKAARLLKKGKYLGFIPLAQKLAETPLPALMLAEGLGIPAPSVPATADESAILEPWALKHLNCSYRDIVPDMCVADFFSVEPHSNPLDALPDDLLSAIDDSSLIQTYRRANQVRSVILDQFNDGISTACSAIDFFPAVSSTLKNLGPALSRKGVNPDDDDYNLSVMLGSALLAIDEKMRFVPLTLARKVLPSLWLSHQQDWNFFCACHNIDPSLDEARLSFLLATMNDKSCPTHLSQITGARRQYFYKLVCAIIEHYYNDDSDD